MLKSLSDATKAKMLGLIATIGDEKSRQGLLDNLDLPASQIAFFEAYISADKPNEEKLLAVLNGQDQVEKPVVKQEDQEFMKRCHQFRKQIQSVIDAEMNNIVEINGSDVHITKENIVLVGHFLWKNKQYSDIKKIAKQDKWKNVMQPENLVQVILSKDLELLEIFLTQYASATIADSSMPYMSWYALVFCSAFGTCEQLECAIKHRSRINGDITYSSHCYKIGYLSNIIDQISDIFLVTQKPLSGQIPKLFDNKTVTSNALDWAIITCNIPNARLLMKKGFQIKVNQFDSIKDNSEFLAQDMFEFIEDNSPNNDILLHFSQLDEKIAKKLEKLPTVEAQNSFFQKNPLLLNRVSPVILKDLLGIK